MTKTYQPLFSDAYLRAALADEYGQFKGSETEQLLIKALDNWQSRAKNLTETQEEGSFMDTFFKQLWGYYANGETKAGDGFTRFPKYKVDGAGQTGGTGEADLALGWFGREDVPSTPQVLCEFKDIRSNLDAKQNRKGNKRSPVKQCADYLRESGKELYGNEAIQPTWGIVTDMNEFRLYWRNRMPAQYQKFVITTATMDDAVSLLARTEEASFQRFLFIRLFSAGSLLTTGGDCSLLKLLHQQWILEKEIENDFYKEYKEYRLRIYNALVAHNQDFLQTGTRGRLVRLAQKLIDRCIFILFCEDMGEALSFPPNALRDFLKDFSRASYYDQNAQDVWNKLKELFRAMDKGEKFLGQRINRFNGGLFEEDPELDSLFIPNHVFCEKLQGENETTIKKHPRTLLYLSAVYNFGTSGAGEHAITLYTLGRIFEQSITELEALEAEADGHVSLTKETKRKRDGVYYTPEWVIQHIVEETIGTRLQEIRDELGWNINIEGDDKYINEQLSRPPSKQSQEYKDHVIAVDAYRERLANFTVCDPACGSGAFLIHVLEYLLKERLRAASEYARITEKSSETLFTANTEKEIREILSRNIYGVDINPSSIEITKLALWLHTAKPNQALCDLDENIRDGNSLIGPEFQNFKQLSMLNADKQEEINIFDWKAAFPKVFHDGNPNGAGFDCIVGNPPYVKLQNFRKKYTEVAEFLKDGKNADGTPVYLSTQANNFDLYLPFIERSISLLNDDGRMGFIAPSVWRLNEYGEGLRDYLHQGKHLERWIDFGSYQVFDEAITYTALQFYSKRPKSEVQFVYARDGAVSNAPDWGDPNWCIKYKQLPKTEPWIFVPKHERELMEKLLNSNLQLGDPKITSSISQGLISGAFKLFANERIGKDTYISKHTGDDVEVKIEDEVCKPLISSQDIDRYCLTEPHLKIIFPYKTENEQAKLMTEDQLKGSHPLCWRYLKSLEEFLRSRDSGKMDHNGWYGYSRNQNLNKQDKPKIVIAGTALHIEAAVDYEGDFATNDKRVYSVYAEQKDLYFLCAILNSSVSDFVFRRIARPKSGGYFDIETQFLAPLPVPKATEEQKKRVGNLAKSLQELYTKLQDKQAALEKRFSTCPVKKRNVNWLFPQIGSMDYWKAEAPDNLSARDKTKWAKEQSLLKIEERLEAIDARLSPTAQLAAKFVDGELSFTIDGVAAVDKVFVNDGDGKHILTYWQHLARTTSITEKFNVKTLIGKLMATPMTENPDLSTQVTKLTSEIEALDSNIASLEHELNEAIYDLYALTSGERRIIEG